VDDHGYIGVPLGRKDEVVKSLGVDVTVTDVTDYPQVTVCQAYPGGCRD